MAYGEKYLIPFLNRKQVDCEVKILEEDYVGSTTTFEGADAPFVLSSQAQDSHIPFGVCATESVIEFYTNNLITLVDFYNEDDLHWKVQFYYNGNLEWSGWLQLDNCAERITDQNHILSLNANDGLGRLESLYLLNDDGTPMIVNWLLTDLLSYIFGLLSLQIDINAYLNIYENSTLDRSDNNYWTFLPQTAITTKYYISDDGTTKSLYDILNSILIDFRCILRQGAGAWNIIRWAEMRLFADGAYPGTRYIGGFGSFEEIFLPAAVEIGRGLDVIPINENQESRILRPYKFVKETFNYDSPISINQQNLELPNGATPYQTTTDGDFRYDRYSLADFFPFWTQINDDESYLQIVTDTSVFPNVETDRYIVTPCCTPTLSSVRFTAIPVTKGDQFDFSLQYRTDVDTDQDPFKFWVRFLLVLASGDYYGMTSHDITGNKFITWTSFSSGDVNNDSTGQISTSFDGGDVDTTQWQSWALSSFVNAGNLIPQVPEDGMLYIQVMGTNGDTSSNDSGTYWKEINLQFLTWINSSIQITGQTHTRTQDPDIRDNEQFEVVHDDSPRNAIKGTLFTDEITTFGDDIGGVYFTKTASWHRGEVDEARRLGDLNTYGDLIIQSVIRTVIEGDFRGLTNVNFRAVFKFPDISATKVFILGIGSIDYMREIFNATFFEIFNEGDEDCPVENIISLDTDGDETTYNSTGEAQAIQFTSPITNTEFIPDGNFIVWTYDGPTLDKDIEVNINGRWDSTASATMNLWKNGVSIGDFFVGTGGAFHFFTANIQVNTNLIAGDEIFVSLNWTGSAVYELEILDGSYLRVSGEEQVCLGDYQFNYIYNTQ